MRTECVIYVKTTASAPSAALVAEVLEKNAGRFGFVDRFEHRVTVASTETIYAHFKNPIESDHKPMTVLIGFAEGVAACLDALSSDQTPELAAFMEGAFQFDREDA